MSLRQPGPGEDCRRLWKGDVSEFVGTFDTTTIVPVLPRRDLLPQAPRLIPVQCQPDVWARGPGPGGAPRVCALEHGSQGPAKPHPSDRPSCSLQIGFR